MRFRNFTTLHCNNFFSDSSGIYPVFCLSCRSIIFSECLCTAGALEEEGLTNSIAQKFSGQYFFSAQLASTQVLSALFSSDNFSLSAFSTWVLLFQDTFFSKITSFETNILNCLDVSTFFSFLSTQCLPPPLLSTSLHCYACLKAQVARSSALLLFRFCS